jgi:hypothetical protein
MGVFVRVVCRDLFVHLEQVAVFLFDHVSCRRVDGIGKIEVDGLAGIAHALAHVALLFGVAGGHIPGNQVAEAGILVFQVVITFRLGNLVRACGCHPVFGHPHPTVVAQAFTHQGQLALNVPCTGMQVG